jgi:hypothetical protein
VSYQAIIAPITVRKHPNADKLQLGTVQGHQVVVGLDVKDGDLGVFFPTDGQLSHEMCLNNHLYNQSTMDELLGPTHYNWTSFGFFSASRRVRAQKFRGEKSDGYWCEVGQLAWTGYDLAALKAGDTFTELNGQLVCNKYYNPATLRAMKNAATHGKKAPDAVFPKHADTEQFRYTIGSIPVESIIWITEKLHGTSGRYGHVLETQHPTTAWGRFVCRVGDWLSGNQNRKREWVYLNGSRNVTLEKTVGAGFYGTNEFRYRLTESLQLYKGEVVYFEIVGFVNDTMPIMQPQPIDAKQYKDVAKCFGAAMTYSYGCAAGECRMYVYRMTRLNEDGIETELPWPQVMQRSKELGLETVPMLARPILYNGDTEKLADLVNQLTDGVSTLDDRHIREGVVLRVDTPDGRTRFLKNKAWLFGVLEGYIKDSDVVDIEEAA